VLSAELYATINIITASTARYNAETRTKTNYEQLHIQILPLSHRKKKIGQKILAYLNGVSRYKADTFGERQTGSVHVYWRAPVTEFQPQHDDVRTPEETPGLLRPQRSMLPNIGRKEGNGPRFLQGPNERNAMARRNLSTLWMGSGLRTT